jgi:Arc/MetJ family transcription regulator
MRTTLVLDEELLGEVKALSVARTKREAVERAMKDFIHRRKAQRLLDLEGKIELAHDVDALIKSRRKDVPHR